MAPSWDDTIAAIASAGGGAARGIIRISGPRLFEVLSLCFDGPGHWQAARRPTAYAGALRLASWQRRVACQLCLWPTARSYVGQPTAELHLPGSPPLLEAALHAVCAAGARLAEPGEFTLRAFLAGRMDLTQAEAVLGVIDAESRQELQVALRQLAGGLTQPLHALREELLELLAHVEAGLDFVDERLDFIQPAELSSRLAGISSQITGVMRQMESRGGTSGQPRIVLRGWPNAGKSSLFNALAGRAAALVSEIAGTTRDYVTVPVEIGKIACLLVDTAGIEGPTIEDGVRAAAQELAGQQACGAHLEIVCLDGARPLNAWERAQLEVAPSPKRILVRTKADLAQGESAPSVLALSSKTGEGMPPLRALISAQLEESVAMSGEVVATTAVRCRESMRQAAECVDRAQTIANENAGEELIAFELHLALDHLGRVVGAVCTDDILDRIFSRFCIGK